jgi:apolipoprotein N-acyltransferase
MFAFVPLLEDLFPEQKDFYSLKETLSSVYSSVFVFIFVSIWWVFQYDMSFLAAVIFFIGAVGIMWLTSLAWRLGKASSGYFGMLFFWLGMEHVLLQYFPTVSPPSLGALMAVGQVSVGWYMQTGILGGSLWVILVNLLVYAGCRRNGQWSFSAPRFFYLVLALVVVSVPIYLANAYFNGVPLIPLTESPWLSIQLIDSTSSAYAQRGEFIGLIGFWMGIFLAISLFVKQKTRLKFRVRP